MFGFYLPTTYALIISLLIIKNESYLLRLNRLTVLVILFNIFSVFILKFIGEKLDDFFKI